MRRIFTSLVIVLIASTGIVGTLKAQMVVSRFDFNTGLLTQATVGPDAIAVDADAASDGVGAYIAASCSPTKGLDLVVPNTLSVFDLNSLGMTFEFKRLETHVDFFTRGGTKFYVEFGRIFVSFYTTDGGAGFISYGPFDTGYILPIDGIYHKYTFTYIQASGLATVLVDGGQVWSYDGPDGNPLDWTGASDPLIGGALDENCNGVGLLDYFEIFNPDLPMNLTFLSFAVNAVDADVNLKWDIANEEQGSNYHIERSDDGKNFGTIAVLNGSDAVGFTSYTYLDANPSLGRLFYRVRKRASGGREQVSPIKEISRNQSSSLTLDAWPIPSSGRVNVSVHNSTGVANIRISDLQGNVVLETLVSGDVTSVDLSKFPKGVYQLQAQNESQALTRKIMLR